MHGFMESMMKMMSSKYTKAYKRPLYRCLLSGGDLTQGPGNDLTS